MRRQGTFQMPFTHSFRLILVLWLVYAEEWLWWQKEDATCCRIGRDGCCPGFRLRFHQVPLSQKSPPCSWPLVCSRHRRNYPCNHHCLYQVLCSSQFSDPVFPLQEHCLLHWPGAAIIFDTKVTQDLLFQGVLHVLLQLQRSGTFWRDLYEIVNMWCCRPFLRAPSLFYTTPSTHQYQVCYFPKNTNVSENSLWKSFW